MSILDPASILLGLALYPVSKMYWRLIISGINSLRDYSGKRGNRENKVAFSDVERLGRCDIGIRTSKRRVEHTVVKDYAVEC